MKKILMCLTALLCTVITSAQIVNPVHFTSKLELLDGAKAEIVFTATIDNGWHVYSTELGNDGPISATFTVKKMEGAELAGKLQPRGNEVRKYDKMFGMELRFFEHKATFAQPIRFTQSKYAIDGFLEYGACNDEKCLPPTQVTFRQEGTAPAASTPAKSASPEKEAAASEKATVLTPEGESTEPQNVTDTAIASVSAGSAIGVDDTSLWTPVIDELRAQSDEGDLASASLLHILLMGFVGGLLAVCMPCIWPIIPMTVSFFIKRAKSDRRQGIRDAITYGISIIVIYLSLGLIVTAIFGSDTLNAMSTNAVFNVFLFLLLVLFALSFFGWFELALPSSWSNKIDQKSEELSTKAKGGGSKLSTLNSRLSIFLMAFTLALVSFSCTAPIIGMLLVETTTSGNWLAPALGMFGFAIALALPFTLFALFPSWLKQAPRSGSWMNTLKVVLGFVELAFALKFLSVADLAYGWHILDREVFLSLWIVIFALLGAYLCGWLRFQSDEVAGEHRKPMPVACIMGGLVSLAFAIYMIPGLWGAPCKAISAFAPPMDTQDFILGYNHVKARFTDYEQGMAAARAEGKPVMVDFTGFGCVNCRKMEAAVWTDPRVASMLTRDYVLISLFVDDKTPLPEVFEVTDEDGTVRQLSTIGAKWSYLQSHKFGANAQPFYVLLRPDGTPLTGSRAYNEDIPAYLEFLREGLKNYK